ncbi:MAG: hypothetical protein ACYTGZ_05195 [Planctomycetota bacterium]|jgi:hypothetical protein
MRHIATISSLLVLAWAVVGCTSAREATMENHEEVSRIMAKSLTHQLEERSDARRLHITVKEFDDHTGASKTRVHRGKVYFARSETPREFRSELIEALSKKLNVVDGSSGYSHANPIAGTAEGMNPAVLVGEYTADEKKTVFLRTRVIDLNNNVVLATAEGVVRK